MSVRSRISLLALIGAMTILALTALGVYSTHRHIQSTDRHERVVSSRTELLDRINNHFGYGGLIHSLKNYVLRGDQPYLDRFNQNRAEFEADLQHYRALPALSRSERDALMTLEDTFRDYEHAMRTAVSMREGVPLGTEFTAEQIDDRIVVDDGPAFTAREILYEARTELSNMIASQIRRDRQIVFAAMCVIVLIASAGYLVFGIRFARSVTRQTIEFANGEHVDAISAAAMMQLSMRGAKQAAWSWDIKRRRLSYTSTWCDMLGYDPGVLPMSLETWHDMMHPDDRDEAIELLDRHIDGYSKYFEADFRMKHRDGRWVWIKSVGCVLERDTRGRPLRVFGMHIDVDRERRLQNELEEKNEELEQFLYTASHDLKSPIVTILGYANRIMQSPAAKDHQPLRVDIDRIRSAAMRIRRNVNDLLEVSYVGRTTNEPTMLSLQEVALEAIELHRAEIDDIGMGMILDLEHDSVWCDRNHLARALDNLISNAIRYGATDRSPTVTIASRVIEDHRVELSVADNGKGIPQDESERVFTLFHRMSNNEDSTGVGLTIVRRIAGFYHGEAWVDTSFRNGARICFTLPTSPTPGLSPSDANAEGAHTQDSRPAPQLC